eukprot:m.540385 g.540385  ORF g.540385 m.540385 type:complete len:832 (+) comp22099_c0_seq1:303-2798(+)
MSTPKSTAKQRLEEKRRRIEQLRSTRKSLFLGEDSLQTPQSRKSDVVNARENEASDKNPNESTQTTGEPSDKLSSENHLATPTVGKSSRLQAKLSRLSELRASRKKRLSDNPGEFTTPCTRSNRFWSQLTSSVTGVAGPPSSAEQELLSTRESLNTAHANIATLREQLAAKTLQLEQISRDPQDVEENPLTLAHENEQLREALLLAKTEMERQQGVIQSMQDIQGRASSTGIHSHDQNDNVLYSMQNASAHERGDTSMTIDVDTTPSREPEQGAGMSLFLDPEIQRYLLRLTEEGADLMQILEEQEVQQSAIDEYEALLAEALSEAEELRSQVRHLRDVQSQMDEQLSEYEQENMSLLAELERKESAGAGAGGDTWTVAKKGLASGVGGVDATEHAGVVADLARAVAARESLEAELIALKRAHGSTTEALQAAQEISSEREKFVDELNHQVKSLEAECDAATANLESAISEIREEEEYLHSELELTKSKLTTSEARREHLAGELEFQVATLEEEKAELLRQLEESERASLQQGAATGTWATSGEHESLATAMAKADNQCPQCLSMKQKTERLQSHEKVLNDKISRLEGNVSTQARQLDEVIFKWSDQVRIFMNERKELEDKQKKSNGDGVLPNPPTPEEQKKHRARRWNRFFSNSSKNSSAQSQTSKNAKGTTEGSSASAPGSRASSRGSSPGGLVKRSKSSLQVVAHGASPTASPSNQGTGTRRQGTTPTRVLQEPGLQTLSSPAQKPATTAQMRTGTPSAAPAQNGAKVHPTRTAKATGRTATGRAGTKTKPVGASAATSVATDKKANGRANTPQSSGERARKNTGKVP